MIHFFQRKSDFLIDATGDQSEGQSKAIPLDIKPLVLDKIIEWLKICKKSLNFLTVNYLGFKTFLYSNAMQIIFYIIISKICLSDRPFSRPPDMIETRDWYY